MYLGAVPGICLLVGLSRRVAARGSAGVARHGLRTGPIHADIDAPATTVYALMTTFDGGVSPGDRDDVVIREFATPVSLPLGMRRLVRTREEIRLVRPTAIEFRHLAGPVRGMAEMITVEPLGDDRCRVSYSGMLPPSGPLLRVAHRLLARPVIERIVDAHLADLARTATAERRTEPAA
jgi:hypothetical protein